MQDERDREVSNADDLKHDYSKKMAVAQDLEREKQSTVHQIQKLDEEIGLLSRQQLEDSKHSHDLNLLIERLILEREDLQNKLEQLQRTYDNCVVEVSRERA